MYEKIGIKLLIIGLFILITGTTFAQKLTPQTATQQLRNQGFVVLKYKHKTAKFVGKMKGVRLVNGELVVGNKLRVINGKNEDVIINPLKSITITNLDGSSTTYSCGCDSGGGTCDVQVDGNGHRSCEGSDCCNLVTVYVSKDGTVEVSH